MNKWKYLFILCFGLLLCFSSVALASIDFTNFDEVNYNTTLENFYASVCENTYGISDVELYNTLNNNLKAQFDLLYNDLNNSSFKSVTFDNLVGVNGYIQIWLSNKSDFAGATINEYTIIHDRNGYFIYRSVGSGQTKSITGNLQSGWSNKWLYYNDNQWYESKFNTYKPSFTPFSFTLASETTINNYDNDGEYYAFLLSFKDNEWNLGSMDGLDEVNEVIFRLVDNDTNIVVATAFKNGSTSDLRIALDNLFLTPRLVYRYKKYSLTYLVYLDGNLIDSDSYNITFMPPNAIINNGVIEFMGSGDDYTIQDSTNAIIDNSLTADDLTNILGSPASGDQPATGFLGGILNGIKGLFIPSDGFFGSYFSDLNDWFSERLGILYFPFDFIIDFLNRILTIDFSEPHMELGPYQLPDYSGDVVPKINIEFNDFLEDELVNDIHDTYLLIADGLIVFCLVRLFQKKYKEVIGGNGE